ncbi:MAG: DUF3500 domain-containing protein, partial [Cytophagales bacterium]|nr:DUF3500 domain-containing protein [Cytophagales bacterium]
MSSLNYFLLAVSSVSLLTFSSCTQEEDEPDTVSTDETCITSGTLDQSSNSEIEAMREAMVSFRSTLSASLLSEASNCLDDERFYLWHNTP